jgi:putative nucleotidyltransferase with HDIG domain
MAENPMILLIDDEQNISRYLREELTVNAGYSVFVESSARGGLKAFGQQDFDLVIIKFGMPDLDSRELIQRLKEVDPDCIIIGFMEEDNPRLLRDISRLGVYDFISKPINLERLFFIIKKGVELHALLIAHRKLTASLHEQNTSLQKQNTILAKRIEESTKNLTRLYEDLRNTYMRTIKSLAQAIDARDHYTHSHSENVARIAVAIAEQMQLSREDIEKIREACELHDLGKIGVEDNILSKPAGLTEEEWARIKCHPKTAAQILEPLTFLNGVIELVRQHHENFDGSGYPDGRQGEDILLGARIIHIADAYEAMRSSRSYRKVPLSKEEALREIKKETGTKFDPQVVEAFLKVVDKL